MKISKIKFNRKIRFLNISLAIISFLLIAFSNGLCSDAFVYQNGNLNRSEIKQDMANGSASDIQIGDSNYLHISQKNGNNNTAGNLVDVSDPYSLSVNFNSKDLFEMESDLASMPIGQIGNHNFLKIIQSGQNNQIYVWQKGNYIQADLVQNNNDNTLKLAQECPGGCRVDVTQNGAQSTIYNPVSDHSVLHDSSNVSITQSTDAMTIRFF